MRNTTAAVMLLLAVATTASAFNPRNLLAIKEEYNIGFKTWLRAGQTLNYRGTPLDPVNGFAFAQLYDIKGKPVYSAVGCLWIDCMFESSFCLFPA